MEKQNQTLFTVIVPVYNVAPYLRTSFDSLLPQLDAETQVIAIDDGSTDDSGRILDEYSALYPQLEVIHQQNAGVAAARNRGLERAKGEYLLWVDPDDWVLPDYMGVIRREIEKKHPDMLIFDYAQCRGESKEMKSYGRRSGKQDKDVIIADLARDWRLISTLWNKVIHRRFFGHIRFDEHLRCLEDYAVLYRIILEMEYIEYTNLELYAYRIREDGLVRSPNLQVGYESYRQSMKRMRDIEEAGMGCHRLGTFLQAKGFCCKYYISGMPDAYKRQYMECKKYLLVNAARIAADRELPAKEKLKYLLIPFAFVGKAYAARYEAS